MVVWWWCCGVVVVLWCGGVVLWCCGGVGGATGGRHHLGISIRKSSAPGRKQIQGTNIPRTSMNFSVVDGAASWSSPLRQGAEWSPEATTFLRPFAHTKARASSPEHLHFSCWSAIWTHAALLSEASSQPPLSRPAPKKLKLGFGPYRNCIA